MDLDQARHEVEHLVHLLYAASESDDLNDAVEAVPEALALALSVERHLGLLNGD